jgi:hypothetical protein
VFCLMCKFRVWSLAASYTGQWQCYDVSCIHGERGVKRIWPHIEIAQWL